MKILNGADLRDFIKERQAHQAASLKSKRPTLLIIRDSDNPVIEKYVSLKIKYGEDIGVTVIDHFSPTLDDIKSTIASANDNPEIHGIILQLPLRPELKDQADALTTTIAPEKDVDGLSGHGQFDSATATAILWLLAGYDINLANKKIAVVGRGKLVGAPLYQMLIASGYTTEIFHRGSDLTKLKNFDIFITATGFPGLILSDYVSPGAVLIDAGTASEKGILKGDLSSELRAREDLAAITPEKGGVGPLTVACLFDHLLTACAAA